MVTAAAVVAADVAKVAVVAAVAAVAAVLSLVLSCLCSCSWFCCKSALQPSASSGLTALSYLADSQSQAV